MAKLIRRPDVQNLTGLRRASIYRLMEKGEFPQPVRLTQRSVAWVEAEIQEWINGRIAARGGIAQ